MTMPLERVARADAIKKPEFHRRLREWLGAGDDRVGDPRVDGRTAWIWIKDMGRLANLHADQGRAGIEEYLALVDQYGDHIAWNEGVSSRGRPSKIAVGPERVVLPSLYLYWAEQPF